MGSALNLAAKGSQFVIQGANSLAQIVHAGTRQPSPAAFPEHRTRKMQGLEGSKSLRDGEGEAGPTDP